jgi:Sel1 repeat
MDPVETKRRLLEEQAAKRRARLATEELEAIREARSKGSVQDIPIPDKPLSHTMDEPLSRTLDARMTPEELDLERQRLDLERQRLELERQKLESGPHGAIPSADSPPERRPVRRRRSEQRRALPPPRSNTGLHVMMGTALILGATVAAYFVLADAGPKVVGEGETSELESLRAKAEAGDAEAMLHLGAFYWDGVGVEERDPLLAKRWLRSAAEAGDAKTAAKAVKILALIREYEEEVRLAQERADQLERQRRRAQAEADLTDQRRRLEEAERSERAEEARQQRRAEELLREQERVDSGRAELRQRLVRASDPPESLEEVVEARATIAAVRADPLCDVGLTAEAARVSLTVEDAAGRLAVGLADQARGLIAAEQYLEGLRLLDDVERLMELTDEWSSLREEAVEVLAVREEVRVAAERASEEAAEQSREEHFAGVRAALTTRAERWFSLREPDELQCSTCEGTQVVECFACHGSGRKRTIRQGRESTEDCSQCQGGRRPCSSSSDVEGFRTVGLRRAFWDFLSPASRATLDRDAVYAQVVALGGGYGGGGYGYDRQESSLWGPTAGVRSAQILNVDVHEDWAEVTARVRFAGRSTATEWTTRWVRVRGDYYVATDADTERERLFPPE